MLPPLPAGDVDNDKLLQIRATFLLTDFHHTGPMGYLMLSPGGISMAEAISCHRFLYTLPATGLEVCITPWDSL